MRLGYVLLFLYAFALSAGLTPVRRPVRRSARVWALVSLGAGTLLAAYLAYRAMSQKNMLPAEQEFGTIEVGRAIADERPWYALFLYYYPKVEQYALVVRQSGAKEAPYAIQYMIRFDECGRVYRYEKAFWDGGNQYTIETGCQHPEIVTLPASGLVQPGHIFEKPFLNEEPPLLGRCVGPIVLEQNTSARLMISRAYLVQLVQQHKAKLWEMFLPAAQFNLGPDPVPDSHGRMQTPLMDAIHDDASANIAALLARSGNHINAQNHMGQTALIIAVQRGRANAIAQLLAQQDLALDLQDGGGYTALAWAAAQGDDAVVNALLEHGANADITDADGATALMHAADAHHVSTVQILAAHANINAQDRVKLTALMHAISVGDNAVAHVLLRAGADTSLREVHGWTAAELLACDDEMRAMLAQFSRA